MYCQGFDGRITHIQVRDESPHISLAQAVTVQKKIGEWPPAKMFDAKQEPLRVDMAENGFNVQTEKRYQEIIRAAHCGTEHLVDA